MKLETSFSRGLFSELLLRRQMGSIFKECDHLSKRQLDLLNVETVGII